MINALTIDVEDYHNVIARDWLGRNGPPTRAVVDNTRRLLNDFAEFGARGTFFVLGEVAETYPDLIRDIAAGGHELGVHGYYHRQVFKLNREEFRREVADAKARIEDIIGEQIRGHRAPAFSIMPQTAWALEVLVEEGFEYDSSVFPIAGKRYGWPDFPAEIHEVNLAEGKRIIEVPLSTVRLLGRRFPVCGGGYLRHFPGIVTRWAMEKVQRERPAILYTHPYEIERPAPPLDVAHLDKKAASRTRWFHKMQQRNRHTVERKLVSLLCRFQFAPMWEVINQVLGPRNRLHAHSPA